MRGSLAIAFAVAALGRIGKEGPGPPRSSAEDFLRVNLRGVILDSSNGATIAAVAVGERAGLVESGGGD